MDSIDAAVARGQAMLKKELARLKVIHVMQARFWIPERESWLAAGRTVAEIIERVNFCGVWLGGPKE